MKTSVFFFECLKMLVHFEEVTHNDDGEIQSDQTVFDLLSVGDAYNERSGQKSSH